MRSRRQVLAGPGTLATVGLAGCGLPGFGEGEGTAKRRADSAVKMTE